jgi:hypothetical protein
LEVKIKKKAGKTQLLKSRHQTKIYTKLWYRPHSIKNKIKICN